MKVFVISLFFFVTVPTFSCESIDVPKILHKLKWKSSCLDDIHELIDSNRFNEIVNAWSNFFKEYSHGNSMDFGDFDSCLKFSHESIKPQHCLVKYQYRKSSGRKIISVAPTTTPFNYNWTNLNTQFAGAICIPSSCTGRDIEHLMTKIFDETNFILTNDYDQEDYCKKSQIKIEIDGFFIFSVLCLLTLTVASVSGTILTNSQNQSFFIKLLQCFSIKRNFKSLIKDDKSTIPFLNGMKAISTIATFYMHSVLFRAAFPFNDGKELPKVTNSKLVNSAVSLLIFMDTFFIINGFLVARSLIKSRKIILWKFYLKRYFRLTPLSIMIYLFTPVNLHVSKNFPSPYNHPKALINNCNNYWWTMALHIQNWVNPKKLCLDMSWFNSVLFQLIFVTPLVHLCLKNHRKALQILCYGIILCIGLFLRLVIFISQKSYFESESAVVLETSNDVIAYTYITLFIRVISFFSGVLLAHIIEKDNKADINENRKLRNFSSKLCLLLSIIAFVIYPVFYPYEKNLAMFYGFVWIIATNFVIFACYRGHGGKVNEFLSLRIWTPISKMGLTIYFISAVSQGINVSRKTKPWTTFTAQNIVTGLICDVLLSAVMVPIYYVTIECSFAKIGNLLTAKKELNKMN